MTESEIEKAADDWLYKEYPDPKDWPISTETSGRSWNPYIQAFLAGAEHAGAKWIKCSERYPDNSSAVLVYVRDGTIYDHCAMYCQAVDYYQFNGQWSHCTDVTHWMELPPSPEGESK